MDYVDRIKALREDKDLKQKDIAKVINKSQQGYAHLENRKAKFSVEDIISIAKYFNVSTDYLLGITDNPKSQNNSWYKHFYKTHINNYIEVKKMNTSHLNELKRVIATSEIALLAIFWLHFAICKNNKL